MAASTRGIQRRPGLDRRPAPPAPFRFPRASDTVIPPARRRSRRRPAARSRASAPAPCAASRSGSCVSTRIAGVAAKETPCVSSCSRLYWHSRSPTFTSPCASRAGPACPLWVWLGGSFVAGALLLRNERSEFRDEARSRRCTASSRCCAACSTAAARCSPALLLMLPGHRSATSWRSCCSRCRSTSGRAYEPLAAGAGARATRGGDFDAIDGDYRRVDRVATRRRCAGATSSGRASSAAPCRRAGTPTASSRSPTTIIGSDSHCPIVRPPPGSPGSCRARARTRR